HQDRIAPHQAPPLGVRELPRLRGSLRDRERPGRAERGSGALSVPQDPRLLPGGVKEQQMSASWESLANDHILGIAPYEPGKPIEELERELGLSDVIKLASNENPLPPSDRVMKAMQDALGHINRYPDGSGHYLRQAIARRQGLTSDHIILGNGSNDLIELMARAFLRSGEEAVIPH